MNRRSALVYVAGPLTPIGVGDSSDAARLMAQNVARGIEVGRQVLEAGFSPVIPHLAFYLYLSAPLDYGTAYIEWDNALLRRCDVMLKYASSAGADLEEVLARGWWIPVVSSVEQLEAWYQVDVEGCR